MYPEVASLCPRIFLNWTLLCNTNLFSQVIISISISLLCYMNIHEALYLSEHCQEDCQVFLSFVSLAGVKWYLLKILICIPLFGKETENRLYISLEFPFSGKCSCLFSLGLLVFVLLMYRSSFYILYIYFVCTTSVFSQFLDYHFMVPLDAQNYYFQ